MPAIAGWSAVCCVCAAKDASVGRGAMFALGVYLGFLLLALIYRLSSHTDFSIFSNVFAGLLICVTALNMLLLSTPRNENRLVISEPRSLPVVAFSYLLTATMIGLVLVGLFHHIWHPLQSWDALTFWARNAIFILEADKAGMPVYDYWNRHPATISIIAAWSIWSTEVNGVGSLVFLPWLVALVAVGAVTYAFGRLFELQRPICILLASAVMGMPLLENHGSLSGYGEIYHALGISLAVYFLVKGQSNGHVGNWILGLCLALSLLAYKNIGAIYTACIMSCAFLMWSWRFSKLSTIMCCLTLAAAILAADYYRLNFFFMGNRVGFDHASGDLFFGGYRLKQASGTAFQVFENQFYSLIMNKSYGVAFISLLIAGFAQLLYLRDSKGALVAIVPILGIIVFSASQAFDLAYIYATPENDTGNSRFMLPIMTLTPMSLVPVIAWAPSVREVGIAPRRTE
jgi:uncharacterized membrane protein